MYSDSVFLSVLFHFVLRIAVFIDVQKCHTNLLLLPSFLIFASVCMILYDTQVLPERYLTRGSKPMSIFLETVFAMFAIELAMTMIWSRVETSAMFVISSALGNVYDGWTPAITNVLITLTATSIFSYCSRVTHVTDKLEKGILRLKKAIQNLMNRRQGQRDSNQSCCCQPITQAASNLCPCPSNGKGDEAPTRSKNRRRGY